MTTKQIHQFNKMRAALRRIAREYASPEQIHRRGGDMGLSAEETIEMAYDNVQAEAAFAIKGVKEIKVP